MKTLPSTCWECSTLCGALLTVGDDGRVVHVAPNPAHPASRGAFCVKGIRGLPELTYGAGRILAPLRRTGARGEGGWREISWDEALDEMADRLAAVRARDGPLAIAGATSGAFFSRSAVFALLLRSLGSPNWMINQDLCGGCRGVSDMVTGLAMTGGEDVSHANTLLLVGANPNAANPIQWQRIKQAKARGARMIVLDPLRTSAADLADLWLRPRPGTDAAIGLAMLHVLVRDGRYDRDFVARWCHGFDALAQRVSGWTPGARERGERRARRRDRAGGASVCRRPVVLRQRPWHRRGDERRADLPRVPLPGRGERQPRSRRGQPPRQASAGLPHAARPRPRPCVPAAARDRAANDRRRTVSALGRAGWLADGLPQPGRDRRDPHRQRRIRCARSTSPA